MTDITVVAFFSSHYSSFAFHGALTPPAGQLVNCMYKNPSIQNITFFLKGLSPRPHLKYSAFRCVYVLVGIGQVCPITEKYQQSKTNSNHMQTFHNTSLNWYIYCLCVCVWFFILVLYRSLKCLVS